MNTEYLRAGIIGKGCLLNNSCNPAFLPYRPIPYLEGNIHIGAFAFDVGGIKGFGVTALEDMVLAANLTFGLLLSRLGITQVNKASPLTAPSVRNYAGISRLPGHRFAFLLGWSILSSVVAYYLIRRFP